MPGTLPHPVAGRRRVDVRVEGTVQGVGFRPFVYRLAQELGLTGWVGNDERGVLYASFPKTAGQIIPLTAVFRAHEVWSGCEYALACLLIQEGLVAEGQINP